MSQFQQQPLETAHDSDSPSPLHAQQVASRKFTWIAWFAGLIFLAWMIVNFIIQGFDPSDFNQLSDMQAVMITSSANFIAQASTFSIAATAVWYADTHGNPIYALLSAIWNWIVICCWFIYILPGSLFWVWAKDTLCGVGTEAIICNGFKAGAMFSLLIVTCHFLWCMMYMIQGVTALRPKSGLRSIYLYLAMFNLVGLLVWFAGQLAFNDKFKNNNLAPGIFFYSDVTSQLSYPPSLQGLQNLLISMTMTLFANFVYYIITLWVGLCIVLMVATMHDMKHTTVISLIWHPLTAGMLWSFVIFLMRLANGKLVNNYYAQLDQSKTIVAGIQILAIVETLAFFVTFLIHAKGN